MNIEHECKTWGLVLITAAALTACGGGGGGGSDGGGGSGGGGGGGGPANSAPTVSGPVSISASEDDAAFTISQADLLANASDANGDPLQVTDLSLQSGDAAAVTVNANSIDVVPDTYNALSDGDSDSVTFSYTVTDDEGASVDTSLTLTIDGVNDAPARVALSNISLPHATVSDDGFAVGSLFADDPEGDNVAFSVTGGDDADHFTVDDGKLVIDDGELDFATQSEYHVTVTATAGAGADFALTVLVLEPQPLTVGYYDVVQNTGRAEQATPITTIGETATNIGDLTDADLSGLDMLFAQNPSTSAPTGPFAMAANQAKISDFVRNGGVFIFHDRHADTIEDYLPGLPGNIVPDAGATWRQFEVVDHNTHLAQGPGGIITDSNLESGNAASFGYTPARSLPSGSVGYLSRNNPEHWITYAYPVDQGWVIYSTIPLDFYLLNGDPEIMRSVYAPNVLAQARALLKKGADTDGDGLLDVEELLLGTAIDNEDTDGDGLLDGFEIRYGLDAIASDDADRDPDGDGLSNREEQMLGTDLRNPDTDGDGLNDADEVNQHGSDPLLADTDGDLLSDFDEVTLHMTDPTLADTDGGGRDDGREAIADGTDPLNPNDDLGLVNLPLELTDGNGYLWDIQRDGNINNGSDDAYDNGMLLFIDGVPFPELDTATSMQDGREVNLGLPSFNGLTVNRRIYVPQNEAFVRYLEVLNNSTDTAITAQLEVDINFGSDTDTVIVTTSGDAAVEATDFYVVTDDASDGGDDPSLAHVFAGSGAAVTPVVSVPLPVGRIIYTYEVTVPANGRAILLYFDSQNANRAAATASADALLGLGSGTLDGISNDIMQDIVNFDLMQPTAVSRPALEVQATLAAPSL